MEKDYFSPKVVLNEEILASIDDTFGSMVEGYTKDKKIQFILEIGWAFKIVDFCRKNPDTITKCNEIMSMIDKKAPIIN